jgi:carboxyl-terminal processing protease
MTDKEYEELVAFAEEKGIKQSKEKIAVSKDKIKTLFKAYVGRNILDEKGFYPIYHKIDDTFKKAVEAINNREELN